jgi:hypothetical protein
MKCPKTDIGTYYEERSKYFERIENERIRSIIIAEVAQQKKINQVELLSKIYID